MTLFPERAIKELAQNGVTLVQVAQQTNKEVFQDLSLHKLRHRPKPGERRAQILQTLAQMLEQPDAQRITTATLAAKLSVSEAALYRHFASKAQMYEGLIEFIEHHIFTLANQIQERESPGMPAALSLVSMLLQFASANPGMTRVMVGDALVFEQERLLLRMNQLFDRLESQWRQMLRTGPEISESAQPTLEASVQAAVLCAFVLGRMQRFVRSGFARNPLEQLDLVLLHLAKGQQHT